MFELLFRGWLVVTYIKCNLYLVGILGVKSKICIVILNKFGENNKTVFDEIDFFL